MTKSNATDELYETISILKQRKARMRLACLDYPKITKLAETGTFGNFPHTGIEDGMEMVYITG